MIPLDYKKRLKYWQVKRHKVLKLRATGLSLMDIAKLMKLSKTRIRNILLYESKKKRDAKNKH